MQIVPVFFRLEINVSFQIVRQEADAGFQRDQFAGEGKQGNFQRSDKIFGGFQIAFHDRLEHGHAHEGLFKVFLVLRRRGGHCAHHVSEVVKNAAGHHRIQVNDAYGPVRFRIQHDIVDFRVVVHDSDGEFPLFLEIQEKVHFPFTFPDEFQLLPAGGQTAGGILPRRFHQAVEPLAGVVEKGNGFMDVLRIHVAQKLLKGPEGFGGFIGLARVFRHIARVGIFDAVVAAPVSRPVEFQVFAPSAGGIQVQRLAEGSFQHPEHFPPNVVGHLFHIMHHIPGAWEYGVIHPLENVAVRGAALPAVGCPERQVDVAAVNRVAMDKFPGNGECVTEGGNLFLHGMGMEDGGQGHGKGGRWRAPAFLWAAGARWK